LYTIRFFLPVLLLSVSPANGQFTTTLQPSTVDAFDQYARNLEQQLSMRRNARLPFLSLEENSSELKKVLQGELFVRPGTPDNPVSVPNGLIHDWAGAVFIPDTTMQKILAILQDFNKHSDIYPAIVSSRLVRRKGNDLTGFWRLERKDQLVPVVLDVEQEAHYQQLGPGKWTCRAYAKNISEVQNAGTPNEKKFPPGEGVGFLWRLYAYWSLESTNNGVLAECRTLSLSRSVPAALAWAIKPFIQSLPRESLGSTLRDTRAAAVK